MTDCLGATLEFSGSGNRGEGPLYVYPVADEFPWFALRQAMHPAGRNLAFVAQHVPSVGNEESSSRLRKFKPLEAERCPVLSYGTFLRISQECLLAAPGLSSVDYL